MFRAGLILTVAVFLAASAAIPAAKLSPSKPVGTQQHEPGRSIGSDHEAKPYIDVRGTASQPFLVSVPRTKEEEEEHATEAREHHEAAVREIWMLVLTVVLTAATVAMAVFTYRLFKATAEAVSDANDAVGVANETLEHARITAQRELRAYVSAIAKDVVLKNDNRSLIILVTLKNSGATPAFDVQSLGAVTFRPKPPHRFDIGQKSAEDAEKAIPTFVLYPEGEHASAIRHTLTDEDLQNIREKDQALYVFGRVTYTDAFNKSQWAEFCAYLDKEAFENALIEARSSPNRKKIPAMFRFTAFGNRTSFE